MITTKYKIVICNLLCLFLSCNKTPENKEHITKIVDGVYALLEETGKIKLEEKENNLIGVIYRFCVNNFDNTILISDYLFSDIKIYSSEGKLIKVIGKKGKGPGELMGVVGITNDSLYIYALDAELRRLNKFSKDGKFLSYITVPTDIYLAPGEIMIRNNNFFIASIESKYKPVDEIYKAKPIAVMDTSGRILYHFGKYDEIYKKMRINWPMAYFDIDDSGNTYHTNYVSWKIFKFDNGSNHIFTFGKKGENFKEMKKGLKGGETREELNKIFLGMSSVMKIEVADYIYFQYTNTTEKFFKTRSRLDYQNYLMLYTKDGKYIKSDINLPGGGMLDVDDNGIIYIELSDEPGNRIIGKYKIRIEKEY